MCKLRISAGCYFIEGKTSQQSLWQRMCYYWYWYHAFRKYQFSISTYYLTQTLKNWIFLSRVARFCRSQVVADTDIFIFIFTHMCTLACTFICCSALCSLCLSISMVEETDKGPVFLTGQLSGTYSVVFRTIIRFPWKCTCKSIHYLICIHFTENYALFAFRMCHGCYLI